MKESVKVECGLVTKINFVEQANSQAIYPSWPFSNDELRKGAFLVYVVCKFHFLNFLRHIVRFLGNITRNKKLREPIHRYYKETRNSKSTLLLTTF